MNLVKRKSDGTIFEASFPEWWNEGDALMSMLHHDAYQFYFREVKWQPRKWWQLKGKWVRTGVIWQTNSILEFDVYYEVQL